MVFATLCFLSNRQTSSLSQDGCLNSTANLTSSGMIPKNFSSLVRLVDPGRGEDRDVKIFMNHPLRYGGMTFYQASFGKNDTLSVLQVVQNPGWLLPYLACVLVGTGLLFHFLMRLL